jgi:MFS family permease
MSNDAGYRSRRRTLSIIFAAHATLFTSWAAHIPQIQSALGLNFATLGIALLGAPLGAVAGMVITGRMLHRCNSAWFLRLAIVGYCVCAPLVGLARSPVELFVALALWGAGQGSVDIAMNAYGADLERRQHRPALPGLHGQWSLGGLAGATVGLATVSMHLTLTAQQVVLGLVVLCVTWWATIGLPALDDAPSPPAVTHKAHHCIQARWLLTLGFLAFASSLCEGIVSGWSAVYLDTVGARSSIVGLGFVGFSVGMVTMRFGGNRLLAWRKPVAVLPVFAALGAVAMAIGLLASTPAATTIGFIAMGMGVALVVPTVIGQGARLAGSRPGATIAMIGAISWTGFVLAPPAVGLMSSMTSLTAALAALPVLSVAIAVIVFATRLGNSVGKPRLQRTGRADRNKTHGKVAEVTLDDLEWAEGYAFGPPTRYGAPAAQLKQFLDTAGSLWQEGKLADKPVTTFVSSAERHGGQEVTILSLNNVFYHWGCVIVPLGYTDDIVFAAGGNPYGTKL